MTNTAAGTRPARHALARPATAPDAEQFPTYHASWYVVARSQDVGRAPRGCELFGKRLVAFRRASGSAVVLDSECAHMGADLRRGRLVNDHLQCPFHGWEYDASGRCVRIPSQAQVPGFARVRSYPVAERNGLLFVFNGDRPRFPLPEFFEPTRQPLIPSRPISYSQECPWWMLGANGFDVQHFSLVHDRRILGDAEIETPSPFARRIRFQSEVVGRSPGDLFIRFTVGRRTNVAITSWGGTLVAVSAQFRRTTSRMLFSITADGRSRSRVMLFVFLERGRMWRRWLDPVSLRLRRSLTRRFINGDLQRIPRVVYRPETLIAADETIIAYYNWLAELCGSHRREPQRGESASRRFHEG